LILPSIKIYDEIPSPGYYHYNDYYVDKDNGQIGFIYTDNQNSFINLTFAVYRLIKQNDAVNWSFSVTNGLIDTELMFNATWYGGNNLTYISPVNTYHVNETYMVELTVWHTEDYPEIDKRIVWYAGIADDMDGFTPYSDQIKVWTSIVSVLMVLLIFSNFSIDWGMLLTLVMLWVFYSIDWLKPLDNASRIPIGSTGANIPTILILIIFYSVITVIIFIRKFQKVD